VTISPVIYRLLTHTHKYIEKSGIEKGSRLIARSNCDFFFPKLFPPSSVNHLSKTSSFGFDEESFVRAAPFYINKCVQFSTSLDVLVVVL